MPGYNQTGPLGQGAMTGRGLGPCGGGMTRGSGQGFRRWMPFTKPRASDLKSYIKDLEDEVKDAKNYLKDSEDKK